MNQRIALVTGGTGGIGTAICQEMQKQDYQVVACYFKHGNHDLAREWQTKQATQGFDIDIVYADISSFNDCEKLVDLVLEKYGKIDVLVNNAGVTSDATLKKMTPEQWQDVINANLNSVFNMTKTTLSNMLDNGYGRIITVSSINGRKGQFGQCNYAASKSALYGFTNSLAQEVAKKGITVNTISPGYISTEMLASLRDDILESIIAQIPVGRLGKPQEIARVVAFLADEQSGFITGANFDINGGQYM
ncbi:TPA: acetoacetyl-CoA reductase [Legionella pneumophila]|uniref:Acetoacetyl-CoA reductase n=1 Tax=Legionella pneumophila TaxID=446 RepID=A0A2S6EW21_LEGPN|nr:acetoacetyl-CoA reductase [Legionella pneumophila]APF04282.1 beta-ketoacyl-ACP reductase [Legionella pneumophila subsp. fraseri]APF07265.1 beta-ketoacyl-ACP reductase [Legionella pneumophila subsp. fraseri]AUB69722.1 beta-ketoacyl-ACP reductase [Legionella pneumophila]AUB72697.1 beta-ketoacyl-ACP reductase [Legionella pneumophila]KXB27328.1 3-ketoacyl-ACP reductase [Legionella pneumophila]